jgi:hypothetical protein
MKPADLSVRQPSVKPFLKHKNGYRDCSLSVGPNQPQ